jgi:hypothetical protein
MLTLSVSAQSVAKTQVTESTVERLVDKYSGKIEATLASLAESLKQPVEFVYTVMVRQQYVKAVTHCVIILITILLLIAFYKLLKYGFKPYKEDSSYSNFYENDALIAPTVILGFMAVGMFLYSIIGMDCVIQGFINPHYGAIKDIGELIKG